MSIYVPIGHGHENLKKKKSIMSEKCSLTIIETPGGAHHWSDDGTELFEYTQLTDFLKAHPDKKNIFENPKEHANEIFDIFGSVAIFGPGEKYPNIEYELLLAWDKDTLFKDIRHSGLIPFDTFVGPEFTTKNIINSLPYENPSKMDGFDYTIDGINGWLNNNLKIYEYSKYPSPDNFRRYVSNISSMSTNFKPNNEFKKLDKIIELSRKFSGIFTKDGLTEGYICVSLNTLMEKFPGNYIHLVCRGTDETKRRGPDAEKIHTMEEMFTKRIPLMSKNQTRQAILNIKQSIKNWTKSRFNTRSTKNTRNMMLAGLMRREVHNELLSRKGGSSIKTRRNRKYVY